MNKEVEIAVTLNTDEANEKLEQLTAKAQALADLFTSIAEQADHAAKIMPPSAVEAVYAMCHGCPPTTNFMRSISEMLRISLPEFEKTGILNFGRLWLHGWLWQLDGAALQERLFVPSHSDFWIQPH